MALQLLQVAYPNLSTVNLARVPQVWQIIVKPFSFPESGSTGCGFFVARLAAISFALFCSSFSFRRYEVGIFRGMDSHRYASSVQYIVWDRFTAKSLA
jgi:hypothetical protein